MDRGKTKVYEIFPKSIKALLRACTKQTGIFETKEWVRLLSRKGEGAAEKRLPPLTKSSGRTVSPDGVTPKQSYLEYNMQRCIKLKLLRPCEESMTWEELGYLLRGLSLKACRMSNFCLTHHLLLALKLETEYLNPQGHLYCYPHLAEEYPEVPTGIICATETRARKLFHKHAVNILRGDTAMVRFRKDASIPIPVNGYKIAHISDTDYRIDIQLLSRQEAKRQKRTGRIRVVLANNRRDPKAGSVLRQLADGTLRRGVASLFQKKKNWYISIPYEKEAAEPDAPFVSGLVMGVAFGVQCALAYAFNRSPRRGALATDEIEARETRFHERKQKLQRQYHWSGRQGHGSEKATQPLQRLQEKERNYRALVNARYAKQIVELAVKNRCGVIHLESISELKTQKATIALARWPVADLQNKICLKAEEARIIVQKCTVPDAAIASDTETEKNETGCTNAAPEYNATTKTENRKKPLLYEADYAAAKRLAEYESGK